MKVYRVIVDRTFEGSEDIDREHLWVLDYCEKDFREAIEGLDIYTWHEVGALKDVGLLLCNFDLTRLGHLEAFRRYVREQQT